MIEIRPLRPGDRRDDFFSGDIDLDRFFQKFAGQNQFQLHIGTTYVAVLENGILGFVTLSATSITIDDLPATTRKRLPHYPLPALRLARLAVAKSAIGQGIGKRLLRATFKIAHEMADRTGCIAVVVTPSLTLLVSMKNSDLKSSKSFRVVWVTDHRLSQ